MQIHLIPDSSVSSAPVGFTAAVEAAADVYDQNFAGNYTVNITYGWGTMDNVSDPGLTNPNSGDFSFGGPDGGIDVSYAVVKSWLSADATLSDQQTAVASLPASNAALPGNANTFYVSSAQEKALGEFTGNSGAVDGSIGFNTGDASDSNYWQTAALCEIGHALGWMTDFYANEPTILDLFRYSSANNHEWTGGKPAYFSIDGGATNLANFSTTFDYTLFTNVAANDPFNVAGDTNPGQSLTSLDTEVLNVIGFGSSASQDAQTITLNDSAMWSAGLLKSTFGGAITGDTGNVFEVYGPILASGFSLTNAAITVSSEAMFTHDPQYNSEDGPHALEAESDFVTGQTDLHLQQQNGASFTLKSIDLDAFYHGPSSVLPGAPLFVMDVTIVGHVSGGSTVTYVVQLNPVGGLQTVNLNSTFANLTSVDVVSNPNHDGGNPNGQSFLFDNIVLTTGRAVVVSETAPASLIAITGVSAAISGVRVVDAGAGSDTFATVVTAGTGNVSATGTGVSGSGTHSLTITGTLSKVNAALATLHYSQASAGTDTVTVTTSDLVNQSSAVENIGITVNPPDVVSETAPASLTAITGVNTAVGGVQVVDAGGGSDTFKTVVTAGTGNVSATGTGVSGSGTHSLTITGTLSQVEAALATLSYSKASAGTDTIKVTTSDLVNKSAASKSISVTVKAADVASETAPASLTAITGVSTAIGGVRVVDAGAGSDTFKTVVTASTGNVSASGAGVSRSGTHSLTITGTLSHVNAVLATLHYSQASAGTDTVTVTTSDLVNQSSASKSIGVTINPPDVVSETAPASLTAITGVNTAVGGVQVVDAGGGSDTFKTVVTARTGNVSATGTGVSGSGTHSLTITGTLGQVDAALGTLSYSKTSAGTDTIKVTTSDLVNKSAASKSISATVKAAAVASTQIAIPSDQDIWTTSVYSFAPAGGGRGGGLANDVLQVGGWGDLYYSLLKFDLGGLPTQASNVQLRLYDTGGGGGTPTSLDLYRITQDWNWQTQGTGSDRLRLWWVDQPTAVAESASALPAPAAGSYYYINLTTLYNAWQAGTLPNYGIELRPTSNSDNFDTFGSSRNATESYQPALVITTAAQSDATIDAGTTIELTSAYGGKATFAASTGTLQLDNSASFGGTVAGMSDQDTIDLRDINPSTVHTPSYSGTSSGGTLTVTDGTHTAKIALLGNYLASTFVASNDGYGGTNIVDPLLTASNQQTVLTLSRHT